MATVIYADFDDMLFESRERTYGAYFLRKHATKNLSIALACIMGSFALALATPYLLQYLHPTDEIAARQVDIILTDITIPPKEREAEPITPPTPPPPVQRATISVRIPTPTPPEDIQQEDIIHDNEEIAKAPNIGLKDIAGDNTRNEFMEIDGDGDIPEVLAQEAKEDEPKDDVFQYVQEEPRAVNMADIQKLVGYPAIAKEAGIQGEVVVRILIDEKGNYMKHKIIKQMHPILAKAVEDQLSRLKFTPAIQGGKAIKFWVNVPFRFKLAQ